MTPSLQPDASVEPPYRHDSAAVFLKAFRAADIAAPLRSLDSHATSAAIVALFESRECAVIGIRKEGLVAGWLAREEAAGGATGRQAHPFSQAHVVDQSASFQDVILGFRDSPRLFVRSVGQVNGVIELDSVDRPPMRMWLFGLITVMELQINRMIDRLLPGDEWMKHLSPGRQQKALGLQAERLRSGERRSLLDCLQFADKGRIVACDEQLRDLTRFQTKRDVEDFAFALQQLRNNLAHAHILTGQWEVILDLARNVARIARLADTDQPA